MNKHKKSFSKLVYETKLPKGYIIPWPDKNNIPKGWQVADGTNNTLDCSKKKVLDGPPYAQYEVLNGIWIAKI